MGRFAPKRHQRKHLDFDLREFGTRGPAKRRWTGGWFSTH